jgi:hypothetical protein
MIVVVTDQVEITRSEVKLEPTIKGLSGALKKARQRRGKERVTGASQSITQWVLCSLPVIGMSFGILLTSQDTRDGKVQEESHRKEYRPFSGSRC